MRLLFFRLVFHFVRVPLFGQLTVPSLDLGLARALLQIQYLEGERKIVSGHKYHIKAVSKLFGSNLRRIFDPKNFF